MPNCCVFLLIWNKIEVLHCTERRVEVFLPRCMRASCLRKCSDDIPNSSIGLSGGLVLLTNGQRGFARLCIKVEGWRAPLLGHYLYTCLNITIYKYTYIYMHAEFILTNIPKLWHHRLQHVLLNWLSVSFYVTTNA